MKLFNAIKRFVAYVMPVRACVEIEIVEGVKAIVPKYVYEEMQRIKKLSGCKDDVQLLISMFSLSRWVIESIEAGYVIGKIDIEAKFYKEVSFAKNIFPNYSGKRTDMSVSDEEFARSTKLYEWCKQHSMLGYEIGARRGEEFVESPVFK